jgi:regulator of protease activity HflC (stomatin/prohibitin superfamily)
LQEYNVGAVDTLIGDITPPDELMKTLTDRKIADQRKVTFDSQRLAEDNRRELEKSKAMADTQASVVTAERSVSIAGFAADATIKQAEGQAKAKTLNAEADATVTKVTGDADAGKTLAVGTAEADVIKLKIASMTSDNYAVIETAKALSASGFKLVPDIVAGGDSGGSNSLMNIFLARLIKDGNAAPPPKR